MQACLARLFIHMLLRERALTTLISNISKQNITAIQFEVLETKVDRTKHIIMERTNLNLNTVLIKRPLSSK